MIVTVTKMYPILTDQYHPNESNNKNKIKKKKT